jgi:hypothetical protein
MSCICGFATIATLIVLAALDPDADDMNIADTRATEAVRATAMVFRLRTPPDRALFMVAASLLANDGRIVEHVDGCAGDQLNSLGLPICATSSWRALDDPSHRRLAR